MLDLYSVKDLELSQLELRTIDDTPWMLMVCLQISLIFVR